MRGLLLALLMVLCAALLEACGGSRSSSTGPLPGTGRPPVTIGDKNYTEQFLLGQLYDQALTAQGFQVVLTPNIGPIAETYQALTTGRLDMYPEYVNNWNTYVAGIQRDFTSVTGAYQAAQTWSRAHGFTLLHPTPFSDTYAIAVTSAYASSHSLSTLGDLRRVASGMVIGAPAQLQSGDSGLTEVEQAYGFLPASVTTLDIGEQYKALLQGTVQAAYMTTTDGQLAGNSYRILKDPRNVFGWGNVVPVVPARVIAAEGPAFARTINRVSRLLTLPVMRRLNAIVDLSKQDPATVAATVAKQFLQQHGLVPPNPPS